MIVGLRRALDIRLRPWPWYRFATNGLLLRSIAGARTECAAPRVVPRIGQRIAAGMTQHVGMNREGQTSAFTDSLDLSIDGVGSERATAFSGEHEWANPFPSPIRACRHRSKRRFFADGSVHRMRRRLRNPTVRDVIKERIRKPSAPRNS